MSRGLRLLVVTVGILVLGAHGAGRARAEMGSDGSGASHEGHAGMSHGSGHESHEVHGSGDHVASAATVPQGTVIRESKVEGYALTYRLYTWDERNVMMKGMEGHVMPGMDDTGKSTHHLMVFIKGADGKLVAGGKVGFVVTGPDKAEFKTLTMGMSDGYGADVPLRAKGTHTIRTKAVIGGRTFTDDLSFTVK